MSILRGAKGTWDDVREAQRAHVQSIDLLTRRQHQALDALQTLSRPRVCEPVELLGGVLFTAPAPGRTVAEEMADRPWDTAALLDAILLSLTTVHTGDGARYLRQAWPLTERSILDVFRTQLAGPAAARYIADLGRDSLIPEGERLDVIARVETAVRRLLRLTEAIRPRQRAGVFGDAQPGNIFLSDHRLTFINPALHWAAGPEPDVAKLISRTFLLALAQPSRGDERRITQGAVAALGRYFQAVPAFERVARLREVMVLWVMDTVSTLATYLSAPAGFPLSDAQMVILSQARRVATLTERVSGLLIGSSSGLDLLETVFHEVEHTVLDLR
ncbi:hypothetical protein ACFWVB_20270 [Streptomyces microflavus]|uniref:hypothetical protein n=1 Tax=Streptomyces microflavus TaxID=1919 RepID=UPI00365AB270